MVDFYMTGSVIVHGRSPFGALPWWLLDCRSNRSEAKVDDMLLPPYCPPLHGRTTYRSLRYMSMGIGLRRAEAKRK